MNSVIMIGRLVRDPELRFVAGSGKAVANFSIAVDRPFSREKQADFFRVVVWGKPAETVQTILLREEKLQLKVILPHAVTKQPMAKKKYVTEIVADNVEFLEWGDRNERESQGQGRPAQSSQSSQGSQTFSNGFDSDGFQAIEDDDDIPF